MLYCTASVWSLVAIAFDRFTATVCPLWYREKRQHCRAAAYAVLVWLLSCLICLPPLVGWDGRRFIDPVTKLGNSLVPLDGGDRNFTDSSGDPRVSCDLFKETNYVVYSATGSFLLPLVILVLLYSRIFHLLQQRARALRRSRGRQHRPSTPEAPTAGAAVWFDRDLELATIVAGGGEADHLQEERLQQPDGELDPAAVDADGEVDCVLENPAGRPLTTAASQTACGRPSPRHHRRRLQQRRRADLREQRATQRMLVIVVVFIICWMPFTLMYLVRGVTSGGAGGGSSGNEAAGSGQPAALEALQFLAIWLGYGNSALNPILYTVFNRDFRHAITRLLKRCRCTCCCRCCGQPPAAARI